MTLRADGFAPAADSFFNAQDAWRATVLTVVAALLTACGGGGGGSGGGGGGANLLPTASFTATPASGVAPLTVAFNAGASSDPDGSIATYAWNFGDGGTSSGTSNTASSTYASAGTYTVTLVVTDNRGGAAATTRTVQVDTASGSVTVSGRATYDRVPFSTVVSSGLSYPNTSAQPIREAVVELVLSSGGTLATTTTDSNGNFAFTAPASTNAFVRVRAQSRRTTTPAHDIRVLNNTNGNALYVLDSAVFNTGGANQTRNLHADSGWGGTSYTGVRGAAPFAILDTLLAATVFVVDNGDSTLDLPALEVFWSTQNNAVSGDVALGQIESTLYQTASTAGPPAGIYVLGDANTDTDEYDQHVLAHEFHHYLEDTIARTDTTGGSHSQGDRLDLRLAFSEGFGNAFSAMVLNDPLYSDSLGPQQGQRFSFNMESNAVSPAGWFNEASIQSVTWDLFDAAADGADSVSIGYEPMFDALTGSLRTGPALTSIFPFVDSLTSSAGAPVSAINTLVNSQSIHVADEWGTTETNDGSVPQSLPIYTQLALNGGAQPVCGTTTAGTYNKIGNRLFLRFSIAAASLVTVQAQYTAAGSTAPFSPVPDPDIVLYRNGFLDVAETTTSGLETLTRTLEAGEYVIEVYEWSHIDPSYSAAQRRGNTCFNVSVTG